MTKNQKNRLLEDMLWQHENRESDFPVFDDWNDLPKHYKGLALEINDHGNVTVWKCFRNGSNREVASRV